MGRLFLNPPKSATRGVAAQSPSGGKPAKPTTAAERAEKITKMVPAEIIAAFITIMGLIKLIEGDGAKK